MCYDLSFSTSIQSIFDYLPNLIPGQVNLDFHERYHELAMGHKKWPVIVQGNSQPVLELVTWGPVPDFLGKKEADPALRAKAIRSERIKYLNVQCESIFDPQKYFWVKQRANRCIIPATGFFEHRHLQHGKEDISVPYYIRDNEIPFLFIAGIWVMSYIPDVDKPERVRTFSLMTRPANDIMKKIHNHGNFKHRMPLMLAKELALNWLDPFTSEADIKQIIEYEKPSGELSYWPTKKVRVTKEDSVSVLEPVDYTNEQWWMEL